MRVIRCIGMFVLLAVTAASLPQSASGQAQSQLKPGDPAPPFSLMGSDGRTYDLADFRGKQEVVLVWFVKAFSAG